MCDILLDTCRRTSTRLMRLERPRVSSERKGSIFLLLLRRRLRKKDDRMGRHQAGVAPLSRACSSALYFRVLALL